MSIPIALPESLTSIKGNGTTVITWVGKPVGKDEYVQAHLTYNGGVYDINNTQEGATFITLNFTNPTSAAKGTLVPEPRQETPFAGEQRQCRRKDRCLLCAEQGCYI